MSPSLRSLPGRARRVVISYLHSSCQQCGTTFFEDAVARPLAALMAWLLGHSRTQRSTPLPTPPVAEFSPTFDTLFCFVKFCLVPSVRSLRLRSSFPPSPKTFASNSNNNLDHPTQATLGGGTAVDPTSVSAAAATTAAAAVNDITGIGNGGAGRPVFHEHVLQALGSLRQRNVAAFSTAVGNARSLALARLGSGGGASQEGGKGLYPCLVQLQCVAEMEEAFEVLSASSPAGGAGDEGGEHGVEDAVRLDLFLLLRLHFFASSLFFSSCHRVFSEEKVEFFFSDKPRNFLHTAAICI